jgi:hypothetical protein
VAALIKQADRALYQNCKREQLHVREYAERHVWPFVERWDQQAAADHLFVPWPAIDAGLEYRMLSLMVPPAFGGRGIGPVAGAIHAEELAAADAGVFVLFGAHELALASIAASLNPGMILRVTGEIGEAERRGRAVLLALAHTEPTAGSDVEDRDDVKKARLGSRCHLQRLDRALQRGHRVSGPAPSARELGRAGRAQRCARLLGRARRAQDGPAAVPRRRAGVRGRVRAGRGRDGRR